MLAMSLVLWLRQGMTMYIKILLCQADVKVTTACPVRVSLEEELQILSLLQEVAVAVFVWSKLLSAMKWPFPINIYQ